MTKTTTTKTTATKTTIVETKCGIIWEFFPNHPKNILKF